jgi:hypothetical protein
VDADNYQQLLLAQEKARVAEVDSYLAKGRQLPSVPRLPFGTVVRRRLSPISALDTPGRSAFAKESSRQTYSSSLFKVSAYRKTSPVISYVLAPIESPGSPLSESYTLNQLIVISLPNQQ